MQEPLDIACRAEQRKTGPGFWLRLGSSLTGSSALHTECRASPWLETDLLQPGLGPQRCRESLPGRGSAMQDASYGARGVQLL